MKKPSLTMIVFMLMNFVLAMSASVFNGILDKVAVDMNISVANSGLLNTLYSFGGAFGVPVTLIVFRSVERTRMLKIMLLLTILLTFAFVVSQNFLLLLVVRFFMGISANSYGIMAVLTVVALSARGKQGRAMAFLIMGSSLALVIGIPLTRALSAMFDWRSIFLMLNALMILALLYFWRFLPEGDHESTKLDLRSELTFFKDRKTLQLIFSTLIMFIGYSAFHTYATPYLILLFPSLDASMSVILVLMGISSFVGNLVGGHVSDRIGYEKSLLLGAGVQTALMVLLFVLQPFKWLSVLCAVLWLMSAWFIGLQLNTGIAQVTQNRSSFMISINSSVSQLAFAIGSSLAAIVIPFSGIAHIVLISLVTSVGLVVLRLATMKGKDRILLIR